MIARIVLKTPPIKNKYGGKGASMILLSEDKFKAPNCSIAKVALHIFTFQTQSESGGGHSKSTSGGGASSSSRTSGGGRGSTAPEQEGDEKDEFPNKKRNIVLCALVALAANLGYAIATGIVQVGKLLWARL